MSPKLARPLGRPIGLCVALTVPALVLRLGGVHPAAALSLAAFGTAVVAASFLLAWAAEAARLDIGGPLAIAILAIIAVLPEYAVDLYFSYTAGHNPDYVQYAAANMTGSNRLLLGLGWPVVVIISLLVAGLFVFAAAVIVVSAEPFAESLITTGTQLGIDRFLLVQWVAPLASEAPEFIVAILFAVHGKGSDAIGTLISSKVSQCTLLLGSLPLAYLAGGGGTALVLDGRQVEEFGLTASQALLGVAALLTLRFPRWLACTLLGLFAVQYAVPGQSGHYLLAAVYGAIALVALVRNRRHILPTLAAPFRAVSSPAPAL